MFPNWHQSYIPKDIISNKYLKISFSENAEDEYIRAHFWEKIINLRKGLYLDIGAYHETAFSNTKLLSLVGWQGIAIDANPEHQEPWLLARPNDVFINCCIAPSGSISKDMEFYRFNTPAMSTANKKRAKEMIDSGINLIDKINVPSLTLVELLREPLIFEKGKIDFVNIDLEWTDYLDDLPIFLSQLNPSLLCLEAITNDLSIYNFENSPENLSLKTANYKIVDLRGRNIFAIPNT